MSAVCTARRQRGAGRCSAIRHASKYGLAVIAYHVIAAHFEPLFVELNGILRRGEQYASGLPVALYSLGPGRFSEYLGRWPKTAAVFNKHHHPSMTALDSPNVQPGVCCRGDAGSTQRGVRQTACMLCHAVWRQAIHIQYIVRESMRGRDIRYTSPNMIVLYRFACLPRWLTAASGCGGDAACGAKWWWSTNR